MWEVLAVAASRGVELPEDAISRNMTDTAKMRPYKTSMCLDHESGRPIEVDAILGRAVRIARENHVSVPYMQCLYALLEVAAKS